MHTRHWRLLSDTAAVSVLQFIGGYVDAAGYLALQLFTSSITGNLVIAATAIANTVKPGIAPPGVGLRLFVTLIFVAGAALGNALSWGFHRRGWGKWVNPALLCLEAACLIAVCAAGVAGVQVDTDDNGRLLLGSLATLGMAFQSSNVREALVGYPTTTVMTMTLVNAGGLMMGTSLGAATLKGWIPPSTSEGGKVITQEEEAKNLKALAKSWLSVASFTIGAMVGAIIWAAAGWYCFLVPVGVLMLLLVDALMVPAAPAKVVAVVPAAVAPPLPPPPAPHQKPVSGGSEDEPDNTAPACD